MIFVCILKFLDSGSGAGASQHTVRSTLQNSVLLQIEKWKWKWQDNEIIDVTLVGTERTIVIVKYLLKWRINSATITSLATASLPCTVTKKM